MNPKVLIKTTDKKRSKIGDTEPRAATTRRSEGKKLKKTGFWQSEKKRGSSYPQKT